MAGPVAMLRNFAVPAGALLVLFTQVWELDGEATWVRILATVFGFLVLVLVLAALNAALFQQAASGTWRERMPSIFVDIVRLLLVVVGLALLFSWVWDANVAGLFAALGVTSIVLGFALQNAVGSIISGLLLLFEQPFKIGDWLDTGSERGRVVEVNWRAVHIDTGNGIRIVPNATLAGASFTNLSQPAGNHVVTVPTTFGATDPPDVVQRAARPSGERCARRRHRASGVDGDDRTEVLRHQRSPSAAPPTPTTPRRRSCAGRGTPHAAPASTSTVPATPSPARSEPNEALGKIATVAAPERRGGQRGRRQDAHRTVGGRGTPPAGRRGARGAALRDDAGG